jgi:hypothetical protein
MTYYISVLIFGNTATWPKADKKGCKFERMDQQSWILSISIKIMTYYISVLIFGNTATWPKADKKGASLNVWISNPEYCQSVSTVSETTSSQSSKF